VPRCADPREHGPGGPAHRHARAEARARIGEVRREERRAGLRGRLERRAEAVTTGSSSRSRRPDRGLVFAGRSIDRSRRTPRGDRPESRGPIEAIRVPEGRCGRTGASSIGRARRVGGIVRAGPRPGLLRACGRR
jgi:hypothetical protein